MKKFDLSAIMHRAWKLFRKGIGTFAECLHRAWNGAKAAPWKAQGREVLHGAKAAFQVLLIYASKGDGQTYRASFFPESLTQPMNA